ncbi:MAG: hypothetical protein M5U29_02495 [Anaerolineae bacterium]|nr:hypothetical protein [Anaerolineae bacterium]
MNETLDMETIYREERQRWLREEAPRRSFRDVVADSVPYWIVIVALVLFGLSAPHTAEIFNMLTPGWGFIAPVGVEFGLLYAAFRRRLAKARNHTLPWTLWAMEVLLFVTAILVNGAGSFVSVVAANNLESLSFSAIVNSFDALPATSQAALIMAALAAFIIPIGTLVAGDGLADLTLEQRERIDFRERQWQEAEFTVIYRAVFVRYMQAGLDERDARRRSLSEVKGYLGTGRSSAVRLLSAGNGQGEQSGLRTNRSGSVKERVHEHLDTYPALEELSVNQVLSELRNAGVKAGRTTVAEVLAERRNGK